MDFPSLLKKAQAGEVLSESEQKEFSAEFGKAVAGLKSKNPEEYLEFIRQMGVLFTQTERELQELK